MTTTYSLVNTGRGGRRGKVKGLGPSGGPPIAVVADEGGDRLWPVAALQRDHGAGAFPAEGASREFVLWSYEDPRKLLARVTTEDLPGLGSGGPGAVYRVEDAHGVPLGRIRVRRGSLLRLGRTRWTVEPAHGRPARGFAGRLIWWALWWTAFMPYNLVVLIGAFTGLAEDPVTCPRRLILRDGSGRAPLVYRGMLDDYRAVDGAWDPRLVAALVGIHQTYTSVAASDDTDWYAKG
ncbi:hypothetical protein J7E88_03940 [Streptomyces sp. ISL-10]|uniref:hypothetical protein n=1 Tax=Streptomyces sp. ISL-10 TaxID=2819172 RepID=UPI001BE81210|nr:hypothetical protein [Streptomyces sp. ISL-10]MBT2364497.1 hypothetical protein [Streptomyces sp. ISL-10]